MPSNYVYIQIILEHYGIGTSPFAIALPMICSDESITPMPKGASQASDVVASSRYTASLQEYPHLLNSACEGSSKDIYTFSKVHSAEAL
jgi:hypothetical protein